MTYSDFFFCGFNTGEPGSPSLPVGYPKRVGLNEALMLGCRPFFFVCSKLKKPRLGKVSG